MRLSNFRLEGYLLLLTALVLSVAFLTPEEASGWGEKSENPGQPISDRTLTAIEGYGMKCVVIYTSGGGTGSAGSGSSSCIAGKYEGDWRRVEPKRETVCLAGPGVVSCGPTEEAAKRGLEIEAARPEFVPPTTINTNLLLP
jgi:hypothetical protein